MSAHHSDGWLVVKRYEVAHRPPVRPLTHESVRATYHGLDGIAWPAGTATLELQDGLLPGFLFKEAFDYWASMKTGGIDLVCLCSLPSQHNHRADDPTSAFCGYDYGNFVSEHNHFSSVLNEVVYGVNEEMSAFASRLNKALLFDTVADIAALESVRRRLKQLGRPLESEEEGEEFTAIGIFRPANWTIT
jgi:hypothetical protein